MAKTKRTVEEAEVTATAAANSDSKLITQSKLSHFATGFWGRIKTRYDGTFKSARLSESNSNDKKLIFTKTDNTEAKVDLSDYVRLQDRNAFKQDVSADNVAILSNRHIGNSFSYTSQHRSLGFRGLTTDSFSDGYVDHIRIYISDNANTSTNSTWFVWAIKKGENNNKNGDRVVKVIHRSKELSVNSITENSEVKKFVNIPIKDSFENDIYFIVRCTTHELQVVSGINSEYTADTVNMNNAQPPMNEGDLVNWANGDNSTNNTVVMYLFGRESIGTLSLKLNKVNSDSGLYVKQDEVSTKPVANKVVRLDGPGKLNKDMLPSIAINEYFDIDQFTHEKLDAIKDRFENGDVVVVTGNGADQGKRFLCVNKKDNLGNLREGFVELNSKDGIVKSVNGKIGEVVLDLVSTENSLKLTIGNGDGNAVEKNVPIVTDDDIDAIIRGLQD